MTRPTPRRRPRVIFICAMAVAGIAAVFSVPPFTRPASYYDFADRREIFGVRYFMDVVSNVPWLIIGILGLWFVARTRPEDGAFAGRSERVQFATLFGGVLLIAVGSGYFHLAPAVATLLWDRLPMTITFMALFSIVIGERIDARAGRLLFLPLLVVGVGSVVYWRYTELAGRGDERLYALVQFFPMMALPVILLLFPSRSLRTTHLWLALGSYGVAKLFELGDKPVFAMTQGAISGHTLKHLAGALAAVWLLRLMKLPASLGS